MITTDKAQELITQIKEGVKKVRHSEDWKAWLSANSKFWNYSFFNQILIAIQRPTASRVAGYQSWKKNFDRQVKKGEKGIQILAPMIRKVTEEAEDGSETKVKKLGGFRVVTVFDVAQTEGKELPEISHKLEGSVPAGLLKELQAFATAEGFTVEYRQLADNLGGFVNKRKEITINSAWPELSQFNTLLHELAHGILGHPEGKDLSRAEEELQAESTAWTVCQVLGISTDAASFGYLASWNEATLLPDALEKAGLVAQRAAQRILNGLGHSEAQAEAA